VDVGAGVRAEAEVELQLQHHAGDRAGKMQSGRL
jgi:hypothetical protein